LSDKESYVRQGTVISMAFIMVQHNDVLCPKVCVCVVFIYYFYILQVAQFREKLTKMICEKTEDSIVKFGAVIAQGILDAGMCCCLFINNYYIYRWS
jgi:26S proteasome regulatory subunit N2